MHPCYNLPKSGWDGTRVDQANTSLWGIVSMGKNKEGKFSHTVMMYGVYHGNQAGSFWYRKTLVIIGRDYAVLGCLFQNE